MTENEKPLPYPQPDLKDFELADLKPDCILVRRWSPEAESTGGIVLPEMAKRVQAVGWVVKVGVEVCIHGQVISVGDTVLFPGYSLQPLPELGGRVADGFTEYGYMNAADVILCWRA